MSDRGRAELRAFENLEYIGVDTSDADLLLGLLADATPAELDFLSECSLDDFIRFAARSGNPSSDA